MHGAEQILQSSEMFRTFSPAELRAMIEQGRISTYAPQEVIIAYGQPGQFFGVMLEGEAEAVIAGEGGERRRIGTVQQGDFLGEISLLTGEPTNADVIALRRCELLLIPQEVFSTVLATNAHALRVMARTITARLRAREGDLAAQSRVEDAWQNVPDPYGLELTTATPVRMLVLRSAADALSFSYYDTAQRGRRLQGTVERVGSDHARLVYVARNGRTIVKLGPADHGAALDAVAAMLTDPDDGVIADLGALDAVGHKVAHGGEAYGSAAVIDEQVLANIAAASRFAPRHNPVNLAVIQEAMRLLPQTVHVAVFDTSFHNKMPLPARLYGLPYALYEEDQIRRYGYHGITHQYAALRAAQHLKRSFRGLKLVTCHLDDEASVCAIDHGRSIDTSTGLTPLEGLITGRKCGDLDPAVVLYLQRERGMSVDEIDELLHCESGLKGLSGISGDFRELEDAANRGDPRAISAVQVFCYRIRKQIGAYAAAMGGLHALVFTGQIGQESAWVRTLACQGLSYMGVRIDEVANKSVPARPQGVVDVSGETSDIAVLVIPPAEETMIARETIRTLGYHKVAEAIHQQTERGIPIEVSAHHVHLSREHVDALFGPDYELTHRADLSQPGQYASHETLNLIGPRGNVDRVRILGPTRRQSQVEIAMTEEFKLGLKAPIRASGDLEGSPGVTLQGEQGSIDILEGVICSVRHIHMTPEDALSFGAKDRDICMVRAEGDRTLIFGDVLIRVNPDYRLAMHIDTDEANAAHIRTGMTGYLVSVQDRR